MLGGFRQRLDLFSMGVAGRRLVRSLPFEVVGLLPGRLISAFGVTVLSSARTAPAPTSSAAAAASVAPDFAFGRVGIGVLVALTLLRAPVFVFYVRASAEAGARS